MIYRQRVNATLRGRERNVSRDTSVESRGDGSRDLRGVIRDVLEGMNRLDLRLRFRLFDDHRRHVSVTFVPDVFKRSERSLAIEHSGDVSRRVQGNLRTSLCLANFTGFLLLFLCDAANGRARYCLVCVVSSYVGRVRERRFGYPCLIF